MADIANLLSILCNEEEIVIKPFYLNIPKENGVVERGKVLSRTNRVLFDYQIGMDYRLVFTRNENLSVFKGDETNTSIFNVILNQRITLLHPLTKQKVLELYYNRFPFLCKIFPKQDVRYLTSPSNSPQLIGSVQQRLSFGRSCYDVYNSKYEHGITLILRKGYLISRIQHQIPEFAIVNNDRRISIGRIYPFSTDLERSQYGQAVAMKVPQGMSVETKATLLIAAIVLKTRLK